MALAAALTVGAQAGEARPNAEGKTSAGTPGERLEFTDLFGSPIPVSEPRADEEFTPEVERFHRSGENAYEGNETALEEGGELYRQHCSSCHMRDATGGMGPSLVDDAVRHDRVTTTKGFFEVVHSGGAGAMPAFGDRLDQEQILKIMAFVESLRDE